ncbi:MULTISPECIES: response regulator [Streptomyces]|uniref:Response regulator transcription factor n=1 Tax=Streptomyces doudnae TaxID=3075536 RepID=A0ABD5EGJ0_9ACTN|nr:MULTISPECIES: response regulator transcription factor [unclassified Streptomyces]MDT0433395.1 response regulator transcription factor [Streptomyces sp. DSM 41981]MYQ62086.1 response regulator [Streptomyces sp. SID4950]SCD30163.1 two component transcriptional regulator, LuxR family [Streptomyces sp. SolWspMP-5a-2]
MTLRIVIADDHAMFRSGFRAVLDAQPDMECVADVGDGPGAVEAVTSLAPDLAVLDVRMPGLDGLATARRIRDAGHQSVKIILLTSFGTDDYLRSALSAGVAGFVLKSLPPDELVTAIRVAARGDTYLDPSITSGLAPRLADALAPAPPARDRAPGLERLTAREHEVFLLMARGFSNAEIGDQLYVGEQTVKTHVSRVLAKLGLRDRVHTVRFAHHHGLIAPHDTSGL